MDYCLQSLQEQTGSKCMCVSGTRAQTWTPSMLKLGPPTCSNLGPHMLKLGPPHAQTWAPNMLKLGLPTCSNLGPQHAQTWAPNMLKLGPPTCSWAPTCNSTSLRWPPSKQCCVPPKKLAITQGLLVSVTFSVGMVMCAHAG